MRLIDADVLKKIIHEHDYLVQDQYNSIDRGMFTFGIDYAIDNSESVDAVEVKHGSWEKAKPHGVVIYSNAYAECSSCHSVIFLGWEMKYCPNCGAKMDGEEKSDDE